jgi:putative FmdB family regulatory protein
MPIYEYTCGECSKGFEHLQRTMADGPRPRCPECGSSQTHRKMSVFAVATDTAGKGAAEAAPMCGRCGGAPGSCGQG